MSARIATLKAVVENIERRRALCDEMNRSLYRPWRWIRWARADRECTRLERECDELWAELDRVTRAELGE